MQTDRAIEMLMQQIQEMGDMLHEILDAYTWSGTERCIFCDCGTWEEHQADCLRMRIEEYLTDRNISSAQEREIIQRIETFLIEYPNAEWGTGHLVLSDDNVDYDSIQFCLEQGKQLLNGDPGEVDKLNGTTTREDIVATQLFLPINHSPLFSTTRFCETVLLNSLAY